MNRTVGSTIAIAIALVILIAFQNCSKPEFKGSNTSIARYSGGQPYDGKPYIYAGTCADGSIDSRIVYHNAQSASLVRENCLPVDPARNLTAADFQLNPANDTITHANHTYLPELAIVPKTSFRPSLSTKPSVSDPASVLIVDGFNLSAAEVKELRLAGKAVLCNFSIGSRESWRPDASSFPAVALGNNWGTNERHVDIRSQAVRDIMVARLNMAKDKGCNGVDLDRADGFENNPGFAVTASDQINYNQFLLQAARGLGLLTGIRSGTTIAGAMTPHADVAIVEQCYQYSECSAYQGYANAGKAVFISEYTGFSQAQCSSASSSGFSLIFTNTQTTTAQHCPQ